MNEVTLVQESYQLIKKDFGLEDQFNFKNEDSNAGRLLDYLTKYINDLIDHDLNSLLNILYRIDISEIEVKNLLQNSKHGEIASKIANTVIEREKQKVITRQQYQQYQQY
ncbi:MAG: hypothetical protein AAFY41_04365 [Bacteroidota bacterium]